MSPESTRRIEIEDFVDLDRIDPIYFESPYYVLPEKNGAKPYRLLVETMEQMRKVAIGRVVIRSKEHLVAIRPLEGLLCVETMRYADEVISRDELGAIPGADVEVTAKELAMARQLIEALEDDFDATKYHDEYREELLALIDKKAAGEEIVAEPVTEAPAKVLDLMAALEASLERTGTGDARRSAKAEPEAGAAKKTAKSTGKKVSESKSAAKKSTRSKRSA